jgi:quercetin dioxygenase-like cupin family protein
LEENSVSSFGNWQQAAPGIRRKIFEPGEQIMSMLIAFDQGAVGPAHSHPHEQLTFVISGKLKVTTPEETVEVSGGEQIRIPGNQTHAVVALEPSVVLETFTPLREDLIAAALGQS